MCGKVDVAESEKLANPGVKLDLSRVGKTISYLEDAHVGETIQFEYDGGSTPGEVRTVLVQVIEGEGIKGATLERDGDFRSYLDRNRVGIVTITDPFTKDAEVSPVPAKAVGGLVENRVRFDAAKAALLAVLTAEQLASLYQQHVAKDSKGVSYDSAKGELVVKTEPPKPTFEKGGDTSAHSFTVKGPNGTVEVYVYEGGKQVGIAHTDKTGKHVRDTRNVKPEDLANSLNEVLA